MKRILILTLAAAALAACGGPGRKAAKTEESKERVVMTGGYTEQRPLSEQEQALFHQVTQGLTGVAYTPESVATQVVAGINYRFVCKARTVTLDHETYQAEVTVYQPLPGQGEARITSIKRL